MVKKRDFASDPDVSRKKNPVNAQDLKTRQQVTTYPDKNLLDNIKILAKVKDVNLNSMTLALIREAMTNEQYLFARVALPLLFLLHDLNFALS